MRVRGRRLRPPYLVAKGNNGIDCSNRSIKDSVVSFYRFPSDEVRRGGRALWISAVKRKNWQPSDFSWLCNVYFVGRK